MTDSPEAGTPPPPDPFTPLFETVPAGTMLYRVHEPNFPGGSENDGTIANPGFGKPTRFAFFGDPPVPVLYTADKPAGAVHETILHDIEPGEFVPAAHWQSKVLTPVEVTCDLQLACLHSDGLRRFGLYAKDLTDTDRSHYPETVDWAEAAWAAGAQGVGYMCRHFNSSLAICLFGDRIGEHTLAARPTDPQARAFALPVDAEWLASLAWAVRVVLRP